MNATQILSGHYIQFPPETTQGTDIPSGTIVNCLTLKQPWAYAIFHLGKDVENRNWTPQRYPLNNTLYIHAGLSYDRLGRAWIEDQFDVEIPRDLPRGGLVGRVRFSSFDERNSPSRWAVEGQYHWIVDSLRLCNFHPCRGQRNIWEYELQKNLRLSPSLTFHT